MYFVSRYQIFIPALNVNFEGEKYIESGLDSFGIAQEDSRAGAVETPQSPQVLTTNPAVQKLGQAMNASPPCGAQT